MFDGLLLVDKPRGWTSFDVVAKVRGILRAEAKKQGLQKKIKVGHTGTLDPMATGLLVLAIGSYTKKVPDLTKQDKTYETQITLGSRSNTDDAEGDVVAVSSRQPSLQEILNQLQSQTGTIKQVPPQFSAIKTDGVRAYSSARAGKEVALEPREVQVYAYENVVYDYPILYYTVKVGSGTKIRPIARDLGVKLGVGGYLTGLRRTQVGDFSVVGTPQADSLTLEVIQKNLVA